MGKTFLSPVEALEVISKGITVFYDITNGYTTIKMLSEDVYEFAIYVGENEAMQYKGGINNLTKTLKSDGMFAEGLYIHGEYPKRELSPSEKLLMKLWGKELIKRLKPPESHE